MLASGSLRTARGSKPARPDSPPSYQSIAFATALATPVSNHGNNNNNNNNSSNSSNNTPKKHKKKHKKTQQKKKKKKTKKKQKKKKKKKKVGPVFESDTSYTSRDGGVVTTVHIGRSGRGRRSVPHQVTEATSTRWTRAAAFYRQAVSIRPIRSHRPN